MAHPKIIKISPLKTPFSGLNTQLHRNGQEIAINCQFFQSLPQLQTTLINVMTRPQWQPIELDCQLMSNLSL